MARKVPKKGASRSSARGDREESVESLRRQIDALDRELVKLVNRRAELAQRIGKLKDSCGQTIYHPGREEEVQAKAAAANHGPLPEECIRAIFRELISGSRALERRMKVAFLGPEYSYSHLAALERFGHCVELVPVGTIAAVFEEVNRDHADFGLVPLENSIDGRIADTLDMFTRLPVRICGEVQLGIHHHLLGKGPRNEIQEVYSKPQALSQCRNWLAKHVPRARQIEVASTSTAAQLAHEKEGAAAIASREAGLHNDLEVLAENIEDNQGNVTRFAVIGKRAGDRTGKDKTAIMFGIEHRSGALAETLAIFKRNRLNMSWIESFPVPETRGTYLFFVELGGHESDLRVRRAIQGLKRKATRLEVLGSYPASEPVG